MRLLSVLIWVMAELGVGTACFVLVQKTGEIRKSFFTFTSALVAVCFLLMAVSTGAAHFFASVYFPAAVFAGLAAWHFSAERIRWGRICLGIAALLQAFLFCQQLTQTPPRIGSHAFAIAHFIAGCALLGWVNGAMILGHWYLIMRGLSFGHLQRATRELLIAFGARLLLLIVAAWGLKWRGWPGGEHLDMMFVFMRALAGIALPGVFSWMAWRCALSGSNQAGTGLLYIAEVAVLMGEIFAGFLGI